jgi:acyl-CoA thioesterase-1
MNSKKWSNVYAVGGGVLQALLLSGCAQAPEAPRDDSANASTTIAEEVGRPEGDERLILAFGDSLYAGYRLGRGESLPDQIENRLRTDGVNATVVNAGVSGDTTAAGRQRLAFALDNLPRTPDLVILGLGGNDVLRQLPVSETRENLMAMMDQLKERDIPVILTGMRAPPNLGPDFARTFEAIWPDLARRYDATLDPFILDKVITDRALMLPDRVHPNAQGVAVMADRIAPLAKQALAP